MKELITVKPDGTELSAEYEEAIHTHQRIKVNAEICAAALLDICKDLKAMRDRRLYTELGFDSFEDYCEQMAGIKSRMAYNYISAYERLGETVLQSNAQLGITKLELIAGMAPSDRTELLESGGAERMSVAEIKELVRKSKEQGEQISFLETQLAEAESKPAEDNTQELRERIAKLEAEIARSAEEYSEDFDEMREREEDLLRQLREKDEKHAEELEEAKEAAVQELSARREQENEVEVQERIDRAVAAAKKEAAKEAKERNKEKADSQAEQIKALEDALTAKDAETAKLQKQLALSDTASAKARVYIQAIQDNFNNLFALLGDMEAEQQNRFKGAIIKLTDTMRKNAEV